MNYDSHKSSLGLDANLVSMLAYIVPIIVVWVLPDFSILNWLIIGVIIFMEKDSTLVRYHAFQSLFLMIFNTIVGFIGALIMIILGVFGLANGNAVMLVISGIVGILLLIVGVAVTVLSLLAAYNAYQWKSYPLPLVGGWAKKASKE